MKQSATFKEKLKYAFDNTMTSGTLSLIIWLGILSVIVVVIAAVVVVITGITPVDNPKISFFEACWQSMMRAMDSGTVAGDAGWKFRFIMLIVTLGGIFILSTLIGVLTSGIQTKIEELRKGKSKVLETNHTLILGWSTKIFSIISELIVANENQKRPRIVILAYKDKIEMEDEIKSHIKNTKKTKIICRSGSPLNLHDLEIANPNFARSIIILSPENENPDTYVIKSMLAVTNNPKRKQENYHIVAEIKEKSNIEAAMLVGKNEAELVLSPDILARVTAQTCRQSGLSVVYTELLDFDGVEIYFSEEPKLVGKTFKEALLMYEDSAIMGIQFANKKVTVNPPMDTVIKQGDKIIVISEDDDTIVLSGKTNITINEGAIKVGTPEPKIIEQTLIIGWNEKGTSIIKEMDNYVLEGSTVQVVSETESTKQEIDELNNKLKKQKVSFLQGNIIDREFLESLNVEKFNHIIILYNSHIEDVQEADAKTLICLLHLRNISQIKNVDFSIVSEMIDIRNKELAEVTKVDDFIIGDKLISLLMSQVSENKYLKLVFDDLFDADGSEIYVKPASQFIQLGIDVDFYTVTESAARQNQVAIGYKIHALQHDSDKGYGVIVDPKKSDKINFTEKDKIIVIAED
ncbi:MAG: potassium transporter TrkA [Bacteroidetes bacterium GWA2_32_17]|nr:MAG: potassium transporter TrkA [Bacteroidetes bacterium GWA2_32_17]